jgi:NADH dehydrogenase [ubiquinone] 1 alpha subcomplex assembly factor 1
MIKTLKLTPTKINFSKDEFRYQWMPFDDSVTGGKSTSTVEIQDNHIVYKGEIKNVNNSSWSSLRSNRIHQDLSNYNNVEIRLKTDGRPYAFEMEYNEGWQHEKIGFMIHTLPNNWTTIHFPFTDFQHVKLGEIVKKAVDLSVLKDILRYNFYVAEQITGPFHLEIEYIKFY